MSYARFGKNSDVYIYDDGKTWHCMALGDDDMTFTSASALNEHVKTLKAAGVRVPRHAIHNIKAVVTAERRARIYRFHPTDEQIKCLGVPSSTCATVLLYDEVKEWLDREVGSKRWGTGGGKQGGRSGFCIWFKCENDNAAEMIFIHFKMRWM